MAINFPSALGRAINPTADDYIAEDIKRKPIAQKSSNAEKTGNAAVADLIDNTVQLFKDWTEQKARNGTAIKTY